MLSNEKIGRIKTIFEEQARKSIQSVDEVNVQLNEIDSNLYAELDSTPVDTWSLYYYDIQVGASKMFGGIESMLLKYESKVAPRFTAAEKLNKLVKQNKVFLVDNIQSGFIEVRNDKIKISKMILMLANNTSLIHNIQYIDKICRILLSGKCNANIMLNNLNVVTLNKEVYLVEDIQSDIVNVYNINTQSNVTGEDNISKILSKLKLGDILC